MKKALSILLAVCMVFALCACGSTTDRPFSPDLVDKLLEADVFSESLEPLDPEIACFLYQLDPEQTGLTDLRACRSAGATCEEVAVFTFGSESGAASALSVLNGYLSTRLSSCRDYMPNQVPKLEHATLTQRENTILFLVADDWTAAAKLIQ